MSALLGAINLGELLWLMLAIFFMVIYFMILFTILGDLFRDHDTSGWVKAAWIIGLILFPFLVALIYLIARGGGMAKRAQAAQVEAQKQFAEYARNVAAQSGEGTATDEIARAKQLLDSGTISNEEFEALKAKALS
jgi:ABC-type multidrug transport system fused ATPase/permease subunit